MIAPLLLAAALQVAPPLALAPAPGPVQPTPPALDSWAALPRLELRRPGLDLDTLVRFVRDEVAAGRCAGTTNEASGTTSVHAPVAVLVAPDGSVRRLVPAAIGCPTVEQFTVGVIGRLAADNVRAPWPEADRWYRSGLTYTWAATMPPPATR